MKRLGGSKPQRGGPHGGWCRVCYPGPKAGRAYENRAASREIASERDRMDTEVFWDYVVSTPFYCDDGPECEHCEWAHENCALCEPWNPAVHCDHDRWPGSGRCKRCGWHREPARVA